jgi:hypothetical protein
MALAALQEFALAGMRQALGPHTVHRVVTGPADDPSMFALQVAWGWGDLTFTVGFDVPVEAVADPSVYRELADALYDGLLHLAAPAGSC